MLRFLVQRNNALRYAILDYLIRKVQWRSGGELVAFRGCFVKRRKSNKVTVTVTASQTDEAVVALEIRRKDANGPATVESSDGILGLSNQDTEQLHRIRRDLYEPKKFDERLRQVQAELDEGKPLDATNKRLAGQNRKIDKLKFLALMKECGWTYDDLEDKTDISKKAIIRAVNGRTTPQFETLKRCAAAFAQELGRSIGHNDLLLEE